MAKEKALHIEELVRKAHANALSKGWWEPQERELLDEDGDGYAARVPRSFGESIALVHSEASEALEHFRVAGNMDTFYSMVDGETKPDGVPTELADIVIRVADICGWYGLDLEQAVKEKMLYNESRSHRHGGKVL